MDGIIAAFGVPVGLVTVLSWLVMALVQHCKARMAKKTWDVHGFQVNKVLALAVTLGLALGGGIQLAIDYALYQRISDVYIAKAWLVGLLTALAASGYYEFVREVIDRVVNAFVITLADLSTEKQMIELIQALVPSVSPSPYADHLAELIAESDA